MREYCRTVPEALDTLRTLDELEAFQKELLHPPFGEARKPYTPADVQRMAHMKIAFQQKEKTNAR